MSQKAHRLKDLQCCRKLPFQHELTYFNWSTLMQCELMCTESRTVKQKWLLLEKRSSCVVQSFFEASLTCYVFRPFFFMCFNDINIKTYTTLDQSCYPRIREKLERLQVRWSYVTSLTVCQLKQDQESTGFHSISGDFILFGTFNQFLSWMTWMGKLII